LIGSEVAQFVSLEGALNLQWPAGRLKIIFTGAALLLLLSRQLRTKSYFIHMSARRAQYKHIRICRKVLGVASICIFYYFAAEQA
jgi:hypothetical protein